MRVLVTVNDAVGHVLPVLPLVGALAQAGHEVLLASPGPKAGTLVNLSGVRVEAVSSTGPVLDLEPAPPRGQHAARLDWAVQRSWPNDARGWTEPLLGLARRWQPDLVVVEPVEHAGRVAAAVLDLPLVVHGWGLTLPAGSDSSAAAGILDLYKAHGAVPRTPALQLDVGPASLQAEDIPECVERYRFVPWSAEAPQLPAPGGRPRVIVTLGTFDNQYAAERLRTAVEGVVTLPVEVVVTLGNSDRGGVSGFPAGVLVTEWLDLAAEVRRCTAVVHHGGAGSTLTTACAGVPAVCLPQGADQFRNADLLAGAGAGLVVTLDHFSPTAVADALREVLLSKNIRAAAEAIHQDNDALPPPVGVVSRLVQLVDPTAV